MTALAGQAVQSRGTFDWVLLLSMAALALNTHGRLVPLVVFLGLGAAGYLRPMMLRDWRLWIGIALVQGAIQVWWWEGIDDHVIVGTYWALAIGLGLKTGDPARVTRSSARWMIGLIFLLAAGWKLLTPEFRDGDFFSLYLLADPRFSVTADLLGGVDATDFEWNRRHISNLYSLDTEVIQTQLQVGASLRRLAWGMTWWGIVIESALAVAWLVPLPKRTRAIRHVLLLVFCVSTYGLVAITGFAAVLLVMGLANAEPDSVWRKAYVITLGAIAVWTPIWRWLFL